MRSCVVVLFVAVIAINLCCGCSSMSASKTQSSDRIGLITFPDLWRKVHDGQRIVVNDMPQLVIRKTAGELIFTAKQGFDAKLYGTDVYDFPIRDADYDYYSDNHFAVSLDGTFRIREANDAEWARAVTPLHSYRFIDSDENPLVADTGITYKNRLYRKTGDSWGTQAALVSPRQRWIAVFSFTSPDKPRPSLIPGFGEDGPGHGDLFIDVYDIASGEKILGRRAWFGDDGAGVSPSLLIGKAVWIEDRYLIAPINSYLKTCFLITLPEK